MYQRIFIGYSLLATCAMLPAGAAAFECNVCHSKNPAMVRMHNALKGQDCFDCHNIGAKLIGKGQPKDRESLIKRRQSDAVCLSCHGLKTGERKEQK